MYGIWYAPPPNTQGTKKISGIEKKPWFCKQKYEKKQFSESNYTMIRNEGDLQVYSDTNRRKYLNLKISRGTQQIIKLNNMLWPRLKWKY